MTYPYQPRPHQAAPQHPSEDLSAASGASAFFSAWCAPISLLFPRARQWWGYWWRQGQGKTAAAVLGGSWLLSLILSAMISSGLPEESGGAGSLLGNFITLIVWTGIAAWLQQVRPASQYGAASTPPGYGPPPGYGYAAPPPGYGYPPPPLPPLPPQDRPWTSQ